MGDQAMRGSMFRMLEVQLVQLAFHKGQVCTCEQVEV